MSTDKTLQISTADSAETEKLGEQIGRKLRGREVIELTSDLGGGKTTFVRGLARGMGSTDTVASPTFMICKQYRGGDITMYHYDFYRLSEPGLMSHELAEGLDDPKAVVVVEWADIVADVLPEQKLTIAIKATDVDEDTKRAITLTCPAQLEYLLP